MSSDALKVQNFVLGSRLDIDRLPSPLTEKGSVRRVGVEVEFGGLNLDDTVGIITSNFGGEPIERRTNVWDITDTDFGTFTIELDAKLLQGGDVTAEKSADPDAPGGLSTRALEAIGRLPANLVPLEIVAPPIPHDELEGLDDLIAALRRAGASGTDQSPLFGFGLHLNPEVATLDPAWLVKVMRAFLLLEELLWDEMRIDTSRKLMPFISKFPKTYAEKVVDADYEPSVAAFIDDYLELNPTRNRDLDLLPLLAQIDEGRVRAVVEDAKIKSRPTFHYRLPDCRLDQAEWSIGEEWRRWMCVEALAEDEETLRRLTSAYRALAMTGTLMQWPETAERLIEA